jgi:hypothetical protein
LFRSIGRNVTQENISVGIARAKLTATMTFSFLSSFSGARNASMHDSAQK